jgi:hypothetical protein
VGAVDGGPNPAATTYQVAFIPTNVVIDAAGTVLATDIHGTALDQLLDSLVEKDPARIAAMEKERNPGTTMPGGKKAKTVKKVKAQKKQP